MKIESLNNKEYFKHHFFKNQTNAYNIYYYILVLMLYSSCALKFPVAENENNEEINIGYGKVKKENLTLAVSRVSGAEIEAARAATLQDALAGKISGVQVTKTSGAPGAISQILIRGITSINGSNAPLYVVDGIPVDNIDFINPHDVASVEVLKDAASTAIYGTRGAAGVILITTKGQ